MDIPITFIALEGVDGAGKSTLANLLAKHAIENGSDVHVLRHPGETDAGAAMRKIILDKDIDMHPLTQAQLILANRNQTLIELNEKIKNSDRHVFIVADRWDMSTLAYQSAFYNTYVETDHVKQSAFYKTLVGLIQTSFMAVEPLICDELRAAVANPVYVKVEVDKDVVRSRLEQRSANERFENSDAQQFFKEVNVGFARAMGSSNDIARDYSMMFRVSQGQQNKDAHDLFLMVNDHDVSYTLNT